MKRKRRIINGAIVSVLSVGISMLAMLIVGKAVTNALLPAVVGVYALVRLGADFLTLFGNFGVAVALPKILGAAPPEERKHLLANIFWGQGIVAAFLCLFFWIAWRTTPNDLDLFGHVGWQSLWPYAWLMLPLFFVGVQRDTLLAGLAGMHAYTLRAVGVALMSALLTVFALLALWKFPADAIAISLALALGYGLGTFAILSRISLPPHLPGALRGYLSAARFSFPLYLNSLVTFFALRFDTVLLGVILGGEFLAIVAVYEMAKNLPMILSRALGALLLPFLPNFAELLAQGEVDKAARLLNHALPLAACIGYAVSLSVVLVQVPLLRLLFSEAYVSAAPVLGLLLAGITLAVQAGLLGQALIALGHTWKVCVANTTIACISILANVMLIPVWGIIGAGWAMVLAFSVGLILQFYWVRRASLQVSLKMLLLPQIIMGLASLCYLIPNAPYFLQFCAVPVFLSLCYISGVPRLGRP